MRTRRFAILLVAVISAAGAWRISPAADPDGDVDHASPQEIETFQAEIVPLLERIKNPVLYEGLPHQVSEKKQMEKERGAKKTLKLHGYDFYGPPQPLDATGDKALLAALTAKATYRPYGGPKFCGKFHPDWCVAWKEGKATYCMLICFGCHEAMFFAPAERKMADLTHAGFETLNDLLKGYRKNRPAPDPAKGMF